MRAQMQGPEGYTEEQWLDLMIDGLETGRAGVPGGPPPHIQAQFVGRSGGAAMRECFPFYQLTKRLYGGDLSKERVLDFGVGWGRLIRLFAHDLPTDRLYGVDVDASILEVCATTGVPGDLTWIEPGGRLPYEDGWFGLAYAYSVFSHLSEAAAIDAYGELARVLRPGGQLTFTTQGRRFLELCCGIRKKSKREVLTDAEAMIDGFFADPFSARAGFLEGHHVYSAVGGGGVLTADFYGWAAIPDRWLRANLPAFVIVDIIDDPLINEQVVVTMRRR